MREVRALPRVVRCDRILDTFWRLSRWGFLLDVGLREGSRSAIKKKSRMLRRQESVLEKADRRGDPQGRNR